MLAKAPGDPSAAEGLFELAPAAPAVAKRKPAAKKKK
jgi:hypothetical protein